MNETTTAIFVEYIGEQTKPILPLAFVTDRVDVAQLDAGRDAFDIQNLPPRICICTPDELERLASVANEITAAPAAKANKKDFDPTLAITVVRRTETNVPRVARTEVGRADAPSLLHSLRSSVRDTRTHKMIESLLPSKQ